MHFTGHGIAATGYDSQRAGTRAKEGAVFCGDEPGRAGPALIVGRLFSGGGGRFPLLRQHRGELAAARHLRDNEFWRNHPDALPVAGISSVSGGDLRSVWSRELSGSPAGAGRVRLGDLLSNCRRGAPPVFRSRSTGGVPPGGALSISCQLCRRLADRDPGDFLYRAGFRLDSPRPGSGRDGDSGSSTPLGLARLRTRHWWSDPAPARRRNIVGSYWRIFAVAPSAQSEVRADGSPLWSANNPIDGNISRHRRGRASRSVDAPKPAHLSPFRTSGSALCHRLRRTGIERLQSLGQDLGGGLRFGAGDLLARTRSGD